jgi:type II secretory pathway pseudopilin PulG
MNRLWFEKEAEGRSGRMGAWTLVEVLVVVVVLSFVGVIAAMRISGVVKRGEDMVARRNAQTLAMAGSAVTASGSEAVSGAPDLQTAVDRLVAGAESGAIKGAYRIGNLDEEAKAAAMPYLRFEGGRLRFVDPGG